MSKDIINEWARNTDELSLYPGDIHKTKSHARVGVVQATVLTRNGEERKGKQVLMRSILNYRYAKAAEQKRMREKLISFQYLLVAQTF